MRSLLGHGDDRVIGPPSSLLDRSWKITPENAWTLKDNTLFSNRNGSFGKEIKTPRFAHYSLDLAWRSFPRFSMHLLGDEKFENYFEFNFQSQYSIYFRKHSTTGRHINQHQRLDHNKLRFLREQETMKLDLYIDTEKRIFSLYIENQLSLEYTDPDQGPVLPGQAVKNDLKDRDSKSRHHFRFFNAKSSPLKITRFDVVAWDGKLPKAIPTSTALPPGFKPKGLSISLRNGDRIFGELLGIKNKTATLKTPRGEIKLPLIFIKDLPLISNQAPNEPMFMPHDIRAYFHNGGHLTFELDKLTKDKITGTSQTFGTATFDLSAFHRLDFNIHEDEVKALQNKANW